MSDCPCSSDVLSLLFGIMDPPVATLGQGVVTVLELQSEHDQRHLCRHGPSWGVRAGYHSTTEAIIILTASQHVSGGRGKGIPD
jgi:hypothetical protein